MPNKDQRHPENAPGSFYVDIACVDCDLCRQSAPANFTRNADKGYTFVFKQPENDQEAAQCALAMSECPVEAIGKDG